MFEISGFQRDLLDVIIRFEQPPETALITRRKNASLEMLN